MRFAHLSDPNPEWEMVAEKQKKIDQSMEAVYKLPLEEFRKMPYQPPRLPTNAPQPEQDLTISECQVAVRDGTKIMVRIYRPLRVSGNHVLFFNVHGGGWTVGSPQTEEGQNRFITVKNRAVVVSVDYRRAPEFPFPYALNDSIDVFKWVRSNAKTLGGDPTKIIVGGGSAGANVATVLAQMMIRDEKEPGLLGQILNIPVTCHPDHFPHGQYEGHSFEQNALAPIVSAHRMRVFWNNYLPSAEAHEWSSPLLSTSLADLPPTRMPPVIQVAGLDPLRDEGIAYAEALRANGVDVTLKMYAGMPHAFYIYPELKSSGEYFETMVQWINQLVRAAS